MVNLLEDDKVAGFKKAYDCGEFDLNTEKFIKEIQNMHITRKVRNLSSDDIMRNITSLVDALIQNQGVRSRIVEIKMMCTRTSTNLKFKIESLTNYIQVKYSKELKSLSGTQAERKSFVQETFNFATPILTKLQVLQDFCEVVINDIDQASWCLKSIIDCVKIADEANKVVV